MAFVANFKTIFSSCGFILSGIGIEDSSELFIWYCIFLLESEEKKQANKMILFNKKELMMEQETSLISSARISTLKCV